MDPSIRMIISPFTPAADGAGAEKLRVAVKLALPVTSGSQQTEYTFEVLWPL
jgi:hypothetical protein